MNILLPTDFSENSWNAIKYASQFFKDDECVFYIMNIVKIEELAVGANAYLPTQHMIQDLYVKPSKRELRFLLKKISIQLGKNKKHHFFTISEYGFFLDSLRRQVEEKNIDLIVMGTKGASGLREYILGSNAGDVITKVKCTTLIVPEDAEYSNLQEVTFPTDYNLSYDITILKPLTEILNSSKANLRIIHINNDGKTLNKDQLSNKDLLTDYFEDYNPSFHILPNQRVEDAIQCFVESRDVDMIVMVAKNLNYFQSILFHTKVEKITYHTEIPFLVIHE